MCFISFARMCNCVPHAYNACGGQERVSDPPGNEITDGGKVLFRCWELNPGPLEEQPVLLTTEASL